MGKLEEKFDTFLDYTAMFVGDFLGHTISFIFQVVMYTVDFIEAVVNVIITGMRR